MNWSKLNCSSDSSSLWSHGLSSSSRSCNSSSVCFLRRLVDLVLVLVAVWPLLVLVVSELFLTVVVWEDSSGLGFGVGCDASGAGFAVELFLLVTVLPSILLLLRGFELVWPWREISSLIWRAVASFMCSKLGPVIYLIRDYRLRCVVNHWYLPIFSLIQSVNLARALTSSSNCVWRSLIFCKNFPVS